MADMPALLEVMGDLKRLISLPTNDYSWSSWPDQASALREIDSIFARLRNGDESAVGVMEVLFLPTGPAQEVSLSSGWGDEFLTIAERFDRAKVTVA